MSLIIEKNSLYGAPNVTPYPLVISHGSGCYLFDCNENKYIDMASGISVTNFGHKHPRLIRALTEQTNKVAIVPRLFHNEPLSNLLKSACDLCNMDKALPMNSGAEAVETALKISRKWAYTVKQVAKDQATIITCDNSFHGRTITSISMSTVEKYKANFGPLTPGFISIPFNNPIALEQAITENTAAFLVEPIQGEAGVIMPDKGYLKKCADICKKHDVLFILDEIQTGMGRTGQPLASQYEDIQPDGILLGKALGGGLLPISLFLAKNHLMNVIDPGEHGSTFGGNPLASSVAYESIAVLNDEKLCENSSTVGAYFLEKLSQIKHPGIADVRGKGLLIAIELNTTIISSTAVCNKLIELGLLSVNTQNKVIRLLPPLTITKPQIDDAVNIIKHAFNSINHS